MKKQFKFILGAAVVVILAGAGYWFLTQSPEVDVLEIQPGLFRESYSEEGTVVSSDQRDVMTLHTATVSRVWVEEGSRVSEGDILISLEDAEYAFALQEMQAQMRVLDAQLLQLQQSPGSAELEASRLRIEEAREAEQRAQENLDRIERLYEADAVSRVQLDEAKRQMESARFVRKQQEQALLALQEAYQPGRGTREAINAQKQALQAQMDLLRFQQGRFDLTAPLDGVVADVRTEVGAIAGPQHPLLTVFHEDDYRIEVMVLTEDVFQLQIGSPTEIEVSVRGGDRQFSGEVVDISPVARQSQSALGLSEERVKVTVQPQLPEDLILGPGYRVDVSFIRAELPEALTVPQTALFRDNGRDAVLVEEQGRIRVVHVEIGMESRFQAVVEEGLEKGARVVINPSALDLREGDRIRPRSSS